jgi:hypothetical protein
MAIANYPKKGWVSSLLSMVSHFIDHHHLAVFIATFVDDDA